MPWPYAAAVCGRYTNTAGVEELSERFKAPISGDSGTRRFNVAPTQEVLAIVAPERQPEARLLRWGLIPTWAKDLKSAYKMINARSETVASKPAYRGLIGKSSRRALQIADGYFEWLKPEKRDEPRRPFFFQVDDGVPFAFAALWTPARIDGEHIESVALLTCDSIPYGTLLSGARNPDARRAAPLPAEGVCLPSRANVRSGINHVTHPLSAAVGRDLAVAACNVRGPAGRGAGVVGAPER
jgi:hypothetical protein